MWYTEIANILLPRIIHQSIDFYAFSTFSIFKVYFRFVNPKYYLYKILFIKKLATLISLSLMQKLVSSLKSNKSDFNMNVAIVKIIIMAACSLVLFSNWNFNFD